MASLVSGGRPVCIHGMEWSLEAVTQKGKNLGGLWVAYQENFIILV